MRNLILIYLLLCAVLVAQEKKEEKQGIELPDFVITGMQSVNMPEMSKIRPKVISTLSKEFFNPEFSPEELTLGSISEPDIKHAEEEAVANPNNGKVKVGAGFYTLPEGMLHYSKSFGNVLVSTQVWGGNEKAHVDNSGYNYSGGTVNTEFFVSNNSPIIPGLRVGLDAFYAREDYKFYGALIPDEIRKKEKINFGLFLANHKDSHIKFKSGAGMDMTRLPNEGVGESYSDNLLNINGNVDLSLSSFSVRSEAEYIIQNLSGAAGGKSGSNYFAAKSLLYYRPTVRFSISAGVFFSGTSGNSMIGPVVNLKLKLTDELSIMGAYSTESNFYTSKDFLGTNRFIDINGMPANIFERKPGSLKFAASYAYNKYFEIISGLEVSNIDNHHYFMDGDNNGKFEIASIDDYKFSHLFFQTNFHLGPFGIFYGEVNYFMYNLNGVDRLPYEPDMTFYGRYGYEFLPGFIGELGLNFRGEVWANEAGTKTLDPVVNVLAGIKYNYLSGLTFYASLENLLGRKDENWYKYQEKPFDISAGIEYRWK